eukprot:scaffold110006_cov24-Tisochrysis_lutea.AAC.2
MHARTHVLVVRAENLPTVRDVAGAEVAPDTFVSAASMREVRNRATPKAVTSTVCASQNPMWGQVHLTEQELGGEQVCLGKASIPLMRVHRSIMLGKSLVASRCAWAKYPFPDACAQVHHAQQELGDEQ